MNDLENPQNPAFIGQYLNAVLEDLYVFKRNYDVDQNGYNLRPELVIV